MSTAMTPNSFWILTALATGRRHGYDIMREVERASDGATTLRATTLYAALERLEVEGHVANDGEEIVNGRARRYYRLTDDGAQSLALEAARLEAQALAARERLRTRSVPNLATPALAI